MLTKFSEKEWNRRGGRNGPKATGPVDPEHMRLFLFLALAPIASTTAHEGSALARSRNRFVTDSVGPNQVRFPNRLEADRCLHSGHVAGGGNDPAIPISSAVTLSGRGRDSSRLVLELEL